ncbi:MAG: class I SAM-dependent methyltransferase [Candidatus Cloacimonadales bacterium]
MFLEIQKQHQKLLQAFAQQKQSINRLWNIDQETAEYLFNFVIKQAPRRILEVGTSNGYSTFWLSAAGQRTSTIVETIEVDEKRYQLGQKNLQNLPNIIQHFGLAEQVIPQLKAKYDLIFLDAGKIGYIKYIKLLLPYLNQEAIVIADNVISHQKTVQEYLDFIDSHPHFANSLIEIGSGLMLSYYNKNRK